MQLSPREKRLIAAARSDLKSWNYSRWFWLLIAFSAFAGALDLQFSGSVFGWDSVPVLQVLLSALGLQGIIWTVQHWDNEKARLLIRLADQDKQ